MSSLETVTSIDDYLRAFGKALGAKASQALDPLHVPGVHATPDFAEVEKFNPDRVPFEPQAHVIAASMKMMDAYGGGFIVGEMGCIAGESEVYDPFTGDYRRVDQITEPFHVMSYDEKDGRFKVGDASKPYVIGKADLFRVTMGTGGKSFVATGDHRVMVVDAFDPKSDRAYSGERWVLVKDLKEGDRLTDATHVCQATACGVNRVASVEFVREDDYYDFTVDEYHNYVMSGCVHHNTGKTIIGMEAVHEHARSKCGPGKPPAYRAVVLCPDHLIDKWADEIESTIPAARTLRFKSWKEVLSLYDNRSPVPGKNGLARWRKPLGPEWIIVGRNQVKWSPKRAGIVEPRPGFGGRDTGKLNAKRVVVSQEIAVDKITGNTVLNKDGSAKRVNVTADSFRCPKCGKVPRDKKGLPLGEGDIRGKSLFCEGLVLKEVLPKSENEKRNPHMERIYHGDIGSALTDTDPILLSVAGEMKDGKEVTYKGRTFRASKCGEALWQWSAPPRRWPPAKFFNKKLKRLFQYLIVDEVHEQKGDDSAQANACGAMIGAARYTLCLTGTLIGGYATDIFPLVCRLGWPSIFREGYRWKDALDFAKTYGVIEEIRTTKISSDDGSYGVNNKSVSMRKEGPSKSVRAKVSPGIMPALYGRHMVGRSVFITLEQMADELPKLVEYVGGPKDIASTGDPEYDAAYRENWFPVSMEMDDEQRPEYDRVEKALESEVKELLKKGSMKLLGAFLHTTLDYPDRPYGWTHRPEVAEAIRKEKEKGGNTDHFDHVGTVGYWDRPGSTRLIDWVGVVTPADCDPSVVRPKEQALIDICLHHKKAGNQTWVYTLMTGKRDVRFRLKAVLEGAGLKVGVLRSEDAGVRDRYRWIKDNGKKFDVIISHPKLVSTGFDLFGKEDGAHNFNVLVFYQTGYSVFDLRQASRRSWRIGQPKDCFVYYLSYKRCMQSRSMQLVARKSAAAMALDGEFSTEGLAGMASGDGAMALVRELADAMDDADMQRSWGKVSSKGGSGGRRSRVKANKHWSVDPDVIDAMFDDLAFEEEHGPVIPRPGRPNPLDRLTMPQQLAAETLIEWDYEFDDEDFDKPTASDKLSPPTTVRDPRERLAAAIESAFDFDFDDEDFA
jgi:hypothetical protein